MIFRLFFIVSLFLVPSPAAFSGKTERHRFVDGLLQRGLYESALYFCDSELQKAGETEEPANTATFFAAEKVRVLTRLAVSLPAAQREPVLDKLEQWERQWERQWKPPENATTTQSFAETFQFPYQLAISDLRLGDLYRLEEAAPLFGGSNADSGEQEKKSLFFLDRSRERLAELRKTVDERIADRTISPAKARELFVIGQQIEFQTAMVWRSLAFGFERESNEQLDSLQRALQGLTPLAALSGTDPILIQSRLEKAACLRLLHELDAAAETLDQILQQKETLSETERLQATAEGIRLFLAQGKIDQAVQWSANEPDALQQYPDLDLARLEAYLSQWKLVSRNDETQGNPLLSRSLEFSTRIEQLHGPYWGRRAQMLVTESTKSETTGEFNVYVQLAEDAYHREQFDDAIRYYEFSSHAAEQAGDSPSAFRFALAAASVESRLENDLEAQKRFCDAAKQWDDQPQAPDAYLFGLELLQKSVASGESPVAALIDGLVDFADTWPNSPQRGEIARKAAQLLEKEGRFQNAFEVCPEFEGRIKTINDLRQLIAEGRGDESLRKAAELQEKNPRDLVIAELYGDLLAASDPEDGLEFWRDVEKKLENSARAGTEAETSLYWKAKETIIRLHFQLGNRDQARKLLDLVHLLYPEQRERFRENKIFDLN